MTRRRYLALLAFFALLVAPQSALAITLAFAVAGSWLATTWLVPLGMSAALAGSIGWLAGSLVGQAIQGPTKLPGQQGPRLDDLKVQGSQYGAPIPIVYGSARLAGSVIWSTDLIETATTTTYESGGKGGGGSSQDVTTYSYSVSCAVAICEGEVQEITRVWADTKLIYDASQNNLDLSTDNPETVFGMLAMALLGIFSRDETAVTATDIRFYFGTEDQQPDTLIAATEGATAPAFRGTCYVVFEGLELADFANRIPSFSFEVNGATGFGIGGNTPDAYDEAMLLFDTAGAGSPVAWEDETGLHQWEEYSTGTAPALSTTDKQQGDGSVEMFGSRVLVAAASSGFACSGDFTVEAWFKTDSVSGSHCLFAITDISQHCIGLILVGSQMQGHFCIYSGGSNIACTTPIAVGTWYHVAMVRSGMGTNNLKIYLNGVLEGQQTNTADATTWSSGVTATRPAAIGAWALNNPPFYYPWDGKIDRFRFTRGLARYTANFDPQTAFNSGVAEIIDDVMARANVTEYDASAIISTVGGYTITRPMDVRSALQPLLASKFIDAVESDGVIKFVPQGTDSVVTIPAADLAARDGGGDPPATVEISRAEETDLPKEVQIRYVNSGADYQQGVQYARRLTTHAEGQVAMDLAVVMDDDEARQIAEATLYSTWLARERFVWATDRSYSEYEPTDVVTLTLPSGTATVRIVKRDDGANGVIQWEGVAADISTIDQSASGAAGGSVDQIVAIAGDTTLVIVDVSALTDDDDDAGYYAIGCGSAPAWATATLYKSTDGGTTYASVVGLSSGAIGTTTTTLAAGNLDNRWDTGSTVTVVLTDPDVTLESVSDLQVYNGANAAAIGDGTSWEVFQFATATLVTTSTYTLSRLLRQRKGSDGTAPASFPVGSTFALLSSGAARVSQANTEIGQTRQFKPVTTGYSIDDTAAQNFTHYGNSLRPYAPVHLRAIREPSGDLTIYWVRRNRLDNEWRDSVDVPMSETSESYEVDILSGVGGSVLRTLTSSSQSTTYTLAQQTADFGSPTPATFAIAVYQLSAAVGRGFAATASV